jgi:hypothetical protein
MFLLPFSNFCDFRLRNTRRATQAPFQASPSNSAFLWGVGRPKRKRLVDILNVGWRPFSCLQAVLTFLELAFSGHSVSDLASTVGYESDEVSGSSPVPDGIVGGVIRHVSRIGSYP